MTRAVLPPEIATEFANLKRRVDALERKLGALDDVFHPEIVFSYAGPLTVSASGQAPRRAPGRMQQVVARLNVEGSTDTDITVTKNEVAAVSLTIPAGQLYVRQMCSVTFAPDVDWLGAVIATAGTDAEDLVVTCRFTR